MSRPEKILLLVFGLIATLWTTTEIHGIHYSVVALTGVGVLLLTNVLQWSDLLAERGAWDVFIWYGGLVRMASALGVRPHQALCRSGRALHDWHALVGRDGSPAARLLLCPLRIRQHH